MRRRGQGSGVARPRSGRRALTPAPLGACWSGGGEGGCASFGPGLWGCAGWAPPGCGEAWTGCGRRLQSASAVSGSVRTDHAQLATASAGPTGPAAAATPAGPASAAPTTAATVSAPTRAAGRRPCRTALRYLNGLPFIPGARPTRSWTRPRTRALPPPAGMCPNGQHRPARAARPDRGRPGPARRPHPTSRRTLA